MRYLKLILFIIILIFCEKSVSTSKENDPVAGSWKFEATIKSFFLSETLVKTEITYSDSEDNRYKLITADSIMTYNYYSDDNGYRLCSGSAYHRENRDTIKMRDTINLDSLGLNLSRFDWQTASISETKDTLFIDHYILFRPSFIDFDTSNNPVSTDSIVIRNVYISNSFAGLPNIETNICNYNCFTSVTLDLNSFTDSVAVETLNLEIYDTIKVSGSSGLISNWQINDIPASSHNYELVESRDTVNNSIYYQCNLIPLTKTDEDIFFFKNEDDDIFNLDLQTVEADVFIIVRLNVD